MTIIIVLAFAIWGGLVAHSKGRNVVGYAALAALPSAGRHPRCVSRAVAAQAGGVAHVLM